MKNELNVAVKNAAQEIAMKYGSVGEINALREFIREVQKLITTYANDIGKQHKHKKYELVALRNWLELEVIRACVDRDDSLLWAIAYE